MLNDAVLQQLKELPAEQLASHIALLHADITEMDVQGLAEAARNLSTDNPLEALRLAEITIQLAAALTTPRPRAIAQRAYGVVLRSQGRWAEAIACLDAGVEAATAAGDALLAAQIPIAKIDALAQMGCYEEAFAFASALERQLEALGASEDAAKVMWNVGNIHFRQESYALAGNCWRKALTYFEAQGKQVETARLQVNIANVLTHLNQLPEALVMFQAARATLSDSTNARTRAIAYLDSNIGFHQFMGGRYTEALQSYTRARYCLEELELPQEVAQCDRETADVYLELNLVPEAQETFERVIPTFRHLNMTGEASRSEMGLSLALASQHRHEEALQALERAEKGFRKEGNRIGVARARLQRAEWWRRENLTMHARPNAEEAERQQQETMAALRTFRKQGVKMGVLQSRLHLAEMRVDRGESPIRILRYLSREAEKGSLIALQWRIETALARAYMNANRWQLGLKYYRRAVDAVERVRLLLYGDDFRVAFLQDKMRLYEELLALLLDRGTTGAIEECFQLVERSKSRTLIERLASISHDSTDPDGARKARLERLEELRSQLNWDYTRLEQVAGDTVRLTHAESIPSERIQELETAYLQTHRELQIMGDGNELSKNIDEIRIQDIQNLLTDNEQIVEYVTIHDEVMAFVVSRRSFQTFRCLASRVEVEELAQRLRYQWNKFGPIVMEAGYTEQIAAATDILLVSLYELLLEPLEKELSSPRLTIIPHGTLHSIPFHALRSEEGYVLDRWEVAYAPSAAVWRYCHLRPEPKGDRSLVFGYSEPDIAHVQEEVAALVGLLPNVDVYEDDRAVLNNVPVEGSFRYLHFATHAIFRKDNPLFSGLKLSDGWLIAHDLYSRRLECSLATLSACRTGMSAVVPGDELLGLARGFLSSGARAVMVSLWAAHDEATAQLMVECYSRMALGASRATALREAQQAVRQLFPHPYYWAAFALIGAR
jgi:CHAT domain-containing protein/tetratricopeptide (TPR) repeat protein